MWIITKYKTAKYYLCSQIQSTLHKVWKTHKCANSLKIYHSHCNIYTLHLSERPKQTLNYETSSVVNSYQKQVTLSTICLHMNNESLLSLSYKICNVGLDNDYQMLESISNPVIPLIYKSDDDSIYNISLQLEKLPYISRSKM